MRLGHPVSHAIQYLAPLYRELATRSEIDLTAYWYARLREYNDKEFRGPIRRNSSLIDGYQYRMLPSAHEAGTAGPTMRCKWDVCRGLLAMNFWLLVIAPTGWAALTMSPETAGTVLSCCTGWQACVTSAHFARAQSRRFVL
jgi:hypothetical protein